MAMLDEKDRGKPLAAHIREISDPDRKARYSNWKSLDVLPVALRGKMDEELSAGEIQTLLDYGPGVRKTFTKVFRGEGNLKTKCHHHLELSEDGRFCRPALALHSLNPDLVESYVTRHVDGTSQSQAKVRPKSGQSQAKVRPKSGQSQAKVRPKSGQSEAKVRPK